MTTPPPEKAPKPGLNIYGCSAVNPYKLTILAEELGIPYNYIQLDFTLGEHKTPWFTAINPNGRLPALVHIKEDSTKAEGKPVTSTITVFESGACMLYLASEFDKDNEKISYPPETPEYWTTVSWLTWQVASYGPMMGQGSHFTRYFPGSLYKKGETTTAKHDDGEFAGIGAMEYGSWRYVSECRRLTSILDEHLSTPGQQFIIPGEKLTIADISIFIFAYSSAWCGLDIDDFPHVKAWIGRLLERPAFQKGLTVPVPYPFSDAKVSDEISVDFYKNMRRFGGEMIKGATDHWWIQGGGKAKIPVLPSDFANLEE